jgi:beta-lactam-binding protein with PASTA domain
VSRRRRRADRPRPSGSDPGDRDPGAEPAGDDPVFDDADGRLQGDEIAAGARRRRAGRRVVEAAGLALFAITAFATGLFVFNNLVMPRLIHSRGVVRVPDVSSLTIEQAQKQLAPLGLQLSRAGERFDPSVPSGFILSQDPPPDTPVRGRRRVTVLVSLGEEFSSVPELYGESLRGARLLVDRAGLAVGGITRAPSDDVGEGLVVASDPPAESVLPRNTPVSLLVSTGAGVEQFVMPELLGREIGSVRRQLEALGFRVLVPPAGATFGTIVFQEPAPGSRITRDAQIVLQATGRMIR